MEITEHLYDRGYLVDFGNGEIALYRNKITYVQSVHDTYHVIRENETLYDIAREYYEASSMWFFIADINDNITDIFDLPVGDTIIIPNIKVIQSRYARP